MTPGGVAPPRTYPYLYRNDGAAGGTRGDGPIVFTEVADAAGLHVDNPATGAPMALAERDRDLSQVERTVTFGLGAVNRVDSLRVIWPDGSEQEVERVEVEFPTPLR